MSLFPLLIVFAAIVAYLPVPNLFDQAMSFAGQFVPHDSMGLVRAVLRQVITPNRGKFLSFGIVGTVWAASGGFSSMMEALNIAYDVPENRPFWKTCPLAIGLTFLIGFLLIIALALMLVGPNFGGWLAGKVGLGSIFTLEFIAHALQNDTAASACLATNQHSLPIPGMPRVSDLSKLGFMGLSCLGCTTTNDHTAHWPIARRLRSRRCIEPRTGASLSPCEIGHSGSHVKGSLRRRTSPLTRAPERPKIPAMRAKRSYELPGKVETLY